jgi:predicted Zn-dependent protease
VQSNVEASRRSEWVFAYARQLEGEGSKDQAIDYYRAGLRLDPTDGDARARLAVLEGGEVAAVADPRTDPNNPLTPDEIAEIPVWTEEDSAPPLERRAVSRDLARLPETTAVLIPVGEVPDWLIDALGLVIQRELGIPTVAASRAVELPPHTRFRGLVFGRQWDQYSLVQAFHHQLLSGDSYNTPAKWILVTGVDIYSDDANFLFSRTHPWGAVVSYARLGDLADRVQLIQRMGKNTLGAFVKSFGVPVSTDPNCVTSYTRNLAEFDAKGNRPSAQSLQLLRENLLTRNRGWASRSTSSTKQ